MVRAAGVGDGDMIVMDEDWVDEGIEETIILPPDQYNQFPSLPNNLETCDTKQDIDQAHRGPYTRPKRQVMPDKPSRKSISHHFRTRYDRLHIGNTGPRRRKRGTN